MKKYIAQTVYSIFTIGFLITSVILFHNNNVLESRINSLLKTSIDFNSEKTFKEDYYIRQQSNDTTLLLIVFPILIGIISIFNFANIVQKFRAYKTEIQNYVKEKETKWNEQHKRLIKLELDLCFQTAINYSEKAKKYLDGDADIKGYIVMSMCAIEKYAQVIKLCDNDTYRQRILNTLNSSIDYDYTLIKDVENIFEVSNLDYSIFKIRVATISDVLDSNGLQMFNTIISKIKIV